MVNKSINYEEVKIYATNLLRDLGINNYPINPFEIAKKMNICIKSYSSVCENQNLLRKRSMDGFLCEFNRAWFIYYNDEILYQGRINNTIMHEIGHYFLGHVTEGENEEAEANFFAKYIMAPPFIIHNIGCHKTVEGISEYFGISKEAAKYALDYYYKWLKHFNKFGYEEYELKILKQLNLLCIKEVVFMESYKKNMHKLLQ